MNVPQPPKTKPEPAPKARVPEKEDSWEEDQEKRGYYYDDAHGYETYVPDDDDEVSLTAKEKSRAIDDDPAE